MELHETPRGLTGLWGELAVVLAFRALGAEVVWEGGLTAGRDLRVLTSDAGALHVQVKTSTAEDGRIAWRNPGAAARRWSDAVEEAGARAMFVFVHFPNPAVVQLNDDLQELRVAMPRGYVLTATPASVFALDVDKARAAYARRTRKRTDRFGRQGEQLHENNLQYPVCASEYMDLDSVFVGLTSLN
jgi:hypothetical protein